MIVQMMATSIATLGVGKIPKAPGTWGSLLALLIWLAIMPENRLILWVAIVIAFFVGWWATSQYEKHTHKHDPKEVVVDELVGMWIALMGWAHSCSDLVVQLPLGALLLSFLLFRFFDIFKPFPIGWVDRKVPGAFGTMLDDVIAGFLAAFIVYYVSFTMGHELVDCGPLTEVPI